MSPGAVPLEADFEEAQERRSCDRRSGDRRAMRRQFDPLFAATLVNHVIPPEARRAGSYRDAELRAGVVVNVRI
jgi:hypothetical protein